MANEKRKRQSFIGGLVEDNPLTIGALTLTSAGLSAITGGVGATEHMAIILDPDGIGGAPEIAYITALTAAAGSCTIARGQEGTVARQHDRDTPWVHGPTAVDFGRDVVFIGPGEMYVSTGTAPLQVFNSIVLTRGVTDAATAAMGGNVVIPNGWTTMMVEALVTSIDAGNGVKNQICRLDYSTSTPDSGVLGAVVNGSNVTVLSPTTPLTVTAMVLLTGYGVTPGALFACRAVFLNTATMTSRALLGIRLTRLT